VPRNSWWRDGELFSSRILLPVFKPFALTLKYGLFFLSHAIADATQRVPSIPDIPKRSNKYNGSFCPPSHCISYLLKKPPSPLITLRHNPVKSFDNTRVVRYILATVFVEKA
jgi:hypothetical protein